MFTKYTLYIGLNDKDSKVQEISTLNANKDFILSYKNTKLFYSRARYAPEQISNVVFIGDKCF